METLLAFDLWLFHWINTTLTHPALDLFFSSITNLHREPWMKYGLLPLLTAFIFYRVRWRGVRAILIFSILVGACDFFNHRVIKPFVGRDRPFRVESVQANLRIPPAGGYSFPSNHAVNTMAAGILIGAYFPPARWFVVATVFLVGYSRPYLGVHYPIDILFGWLMGAVITILFLKALRKWAPKWGPE